MLKCEAFRDHAHSNEKQCYFFIALWRQFFTITAVISPDWKIHTNLLCKIQPCIHIMSAFVMTMDLWPYLMLFSCRLWQCKPLGVGQRRYKLTHRAGPVQGHGSAVLPQPWAAAAGAQQNCFKLLSHHQTLQVWRIVIVYQNDSI